MTPIMKPILFNTEMVRAILEGRKTVTRRVVKPQPVAIQGKRIEVSAGLNCDWLWNEGAKEEYIKAPYSSGDILYVRESFWKGPGGYEYKADYEGDNPGYVCSPSIHMPREAARIFLRVTDVWVEQLQDITEYGAIAEGVTGIPCDCEEEVFCSRCCNTGWIESPRSEFAKLWNSTVKPADLPLYGWGANPWVWVYKYERISREETENG